MLIRSITFSDCTAACDSIACFSAPMAGWPSGTPAALAAALTLLVSLQSANALRSARIGLMASNGWTSRVSMSSTTDESVPAAEAQSVVVIGGGWAGFGAAWGLSQRGVQVTLLEAAPQAVGGLAAGWSGPDGRPVELGIHGFWRSYRNCFRLVEQLGLADTDVFTEWASPALYNAEGLSVVAPVFGDLPRLPTPIGSALYPRFERLSLADRASAVGLLYEFVDFDGSDEAWVRYDSISARELFRSKGVSRGLYDGFLEPMLLVLPMAPGEEVSAAAALSLLQYFALEHQGDFDVRWLRSSLTSAVFETWIEKLEIAGARVLRGKRVNDVEVERGSVTAVKCADGSQYAASAVVMAVGISGAKSILRSCSSLARLPELNGAMHLRGVDVVAVRLWFAQARALPHASNVVGHGVPALLRDVGWTFYDLSTLQAPVHDSEPGTVIECDFYHAAPLLPLPDADVVNVALQGLHQLLPSVFADADVEKGTLLHSSVMRAPQAVSHFLPGAYRHLPKGVRLSSLRNFYLAGDWVDRGGHRSWSQEKALVTGLQAAAAAVEDGVATAVASRIDAASTAIGSSAAAPKSGTTSAYLATRIDEAGLTPLQVEETEAHVAFARWGQGQFVRPALDVLRSVLPGL